MLSATMEQPLKQSAKPVFGTSGRGEEPGALASRWEHGSEFAWVNPSETELEGPGLPAGAILFGGGGQALVAVLKSGVRARGWTRCFVPSYCCESLVRAVREAGLDCAPYDDLPLPDVQPRWPSSLSAGDCVLVINHFGWRSRVLSERVRQSPAGLIEDHTHDPWSDWSRNSEADYCIASLRKTLPVPDGGVAWSPRQLPLRAPSQLLARHEHNALRKLAAMLLKARYLAGEPVAKDLYRTLQTESEEHWTTTPSLPLPITRQLLVGFRWHSWREQRQRNVHSLGEALRGIQGITVLNPPSGGRVGNRCDFGVVIRCESARLREALREHLVRHRVYPAVLWPPHPLMEGFSAAVAFSQEMLFLHADFRYGEEDLSRVADLIRGYFKA